MDFLTIKPKRLELIYTKGEKTCSEIRQSEGCDICFNGTLYDTNNYKPLCDVKIYDEIFEEGKYIYDGYAWNSGDARAKYFTSNNAISPNWHDYDYFISCVFMIVDGQKVEMYPDAYIAKKHPRTMMGYLPNGDMVIGVTTQSEEYTPWELQDIAYDLGCESAIMLDGGGSSQIDSDELTIKSSRKVSNYLCVWIDDEEEPVEPDPEQPPVESEIPAEPEEPTPNPDPEIPEVQPEEPTFPEEDNKLATPSHSKKPDWSVYYSESYNITDIVSFKPGQIYNNLTLINKNDDGTWSCQCICGNIINVKEDRLTGGIQSCGCKERFIKKFNPYLRWTINLD